MERYISKNEENFEDKNGKLEEEIKQLQQRIRELEEQKSRAQEKSEKFEENVEKMNGHHLTSKIVTHPNKTELTSSSTKSDFHPYNKRKGVVDQGKEFEILMCTLYALKFCTDERVIDFNMTTNNNKCGDFDDIELEVTLENNVKRTYLFQLKHKENIRERITREMLTKEFMQKNKKQDKKSKFYLINYFKSMSNIKMKKRDVVYILYTNGKTEIENGEKLEFKAYNLEVSKCDEIEYEDLLINAETEDRSVFQFKPAFTTDTIDEKVEKLCNGFYFFTKQDNLETVKNSVREKLKGLVQSDIYGSFEHFMKNWWSSNFVLTKHHVITKLTELALSPYVRTISAAKHNKKTKILEEAIMEFELTIVEDSEEDIVRNIWTETQTECDWALPLKSFFELAESKPTEMQVSKILWYLGKAPLVVKIDTSNETIVESVLNLLQKGNRSKKVLLLGNVRREDFGGWDIFENLYDLKTKCGNGHIYNQLVCSFEVSFQGRNCVSLEKLSFTDEEFIKVLRASELFKISQVEHFLIGDKKTDLPPFYMPRCASTYSIDMKDILTLYRQGNDNVIIINCDDIFKKKLRSQNVNAVELCQYLNDQKFEGYRNFILVSTANRCTSFDFDKICQRFKYSNIYVFQTWNNDCCLLLMTNGNKLPVLENTKSRKYVEETKIMTCFDNPLNIFCAPPGMGKSTLMKVLSNSCSSEFWTIRVELVNYNSFLAKNPDFETIRSRFLHSDTSKDPLTNQLKNILWKNGKVYLFLDGLDEVDSKFVHVVIDFAKRVSSEGYKVWISSRENLRDKISHCLNVVPIEIKEVDEEQQKSYLQQKLETKYQKEKIEKIVRAVYESADINNSQDLLGIPLQLHIITEMFLNNEEAYAKLQQENMFVLIHMYKLFFQGKVTTTLEKIGIDEATKSQLNFNDEEILEKYELPALKSCLDDADYQKLEIGVDCVEKCLNTFKKDGDKFGIIKSIGGDYETVFNHQTYAEYFACEWFKRHKDKVKLLSDVIFAPRYDNLRRMFDIMLAEKNPLHLAIIYENLEQFERNLEDLRKPDEGGRTALHLICSYGNKYPQEITNGLSRESTSYLEMVEKLFQEDINIQEEDSLFNFNTMKYIKESKCLYPLEKILETELYDFDDFHSEFGNHYNVETVVFYAAQFGYPNLLRKLVTSNPYLLHQEIDDSTLLETVILGHKNDTCATPRTGNVSAVKVLVALGADLHITDSANRNLLHYACMSEAPNTEMIDLLMGLGLDLNFQDFDGETTLHCACRRGNSNIFTLLLHRGADPYIKDNEDQNVMHHAAMSLNPNSKILDFLVNLGFEVDAQDQNGITALHLTCRDGHVTNTDFLLRKGADPNVKDNEDRNALHYACESYEESLEKVRLLLGHGVEVNQKDLNGNTALQFACKNGHTQIVKLLLDRGADPNVKDKEESNSLHFACQTYTSNTEILGCLMERGVDVNEQDGSGRTALQIACQYGSLKNARVLVENGADPFIADGKGRNSLVYARRSGNSYGLTNFLLELSAFKTRL